MTKDKERRPVGRPKGYRKLDALIVCDMAIALDVDDAKWFKAIPKGKKAQIIRDAIALYRATNEQTGEK
jgi:hypothetical protein